MTPEVASKIINLFLAGNSFNHIVFLLGYEVLIDDISAVVREAVTRGLAAERKLLYMDSAAIKLADAVKVVLPKLRCTCPSTVHDTIILSAYCPYCDLKKALRETTDLR